jgi:RNA polymerase sigma factor (sigma-70 family)
MADGTVDTLQLHGFVERWQAGDRAAADELLRGLGSRLHHLTRQMLRHFPNVRCWAETADVCQGSLLRLLNSLKKVRPASTRDFVNLAAVHIRRELLDLARHFAGRGQAPLAAAADLADGKGDGTAQAAALESWCRFHEAVEQLPGEQREVVGLMFYHGYTQVQVAELLRMSERTVRRHWVAACLRLNQLVGGDLPPC